MIIKNISPTNYVLYFYKEEHTNELLVVYMYEQVINKQEVDKFCFLLSLR